MQSDYVLSEYHSAQVLINQIKYELNYFN